MRNFRVNNQYVRGQITGTDSTGRLALQIEEKLHYFDLKEITYLPDANLPTPAPE